MTVKSDHIERLLSDEYLQEAFDNVRAAIHNGWANTKPSDSEALEEWHRRLFTLRSVEENLKQAVQDGKLEDFRVAEQEKIPPLGDILKWKKTRNQA
jgi:hypothetical protein